MNYWYIAYDIVGLSLSLFVAFLVYKIFMSSKQGIGGISREL